MGEIISLHEGLYSYELPPVPHEQDIWYYDVIPSQQYWRTPAAKNFKFLDPNGNIRNVKQMNERDRIRYIEYWRDKYENGLWVMINGEPTYLTGMHIDHLIFNKFDGRNFMYLDSQRERFYFRDKTDKDPLCDGRCWAKGRRVGITAEEITQAIRVVNDDFYNHVALQSDTQEKAKTTLLFKIIDTFIKRPEWMRDKYYNSNGKVPRSALELVDVMVKTDMQEPLAGTVRHFASTVKAIDGMAFMLDVMDEFSKWVDVSPYETFEVNKKTIVNPGKRGKLDALSTTGDGKESQKSVKDWHKLIANSNPLARNKNGKTNSGLYLWFVSYIHSLELLTNYPAIMDKYGKVNREMAEEYIWNEVKQYPKDSKEFTYALYKMPMTLKHVLLTPTGQGIFSKLRITARLDELRALPYDEKPYVLGSLEYDQNGDVYFESNEERRERCEKEGTEYKQGYWMIALHPYFSAEKNIDTRNRCRKINGIFFPPVNQEFGWGYDPIRYRKEDTTSNSLSDAAIVFWKKFDYYGAGDANQFAALYLYRPDDPHDATKEAIKGAKYYSAAGMHERTMESVKEDFNDAGCLPLLMQSEKDELYGLVVDSNGKMVKNATEEMVTLFGPPKTEKDRDQIATCPFEPVLENLDGIDLANTTAFDVYMAMCEMMHCLKQVLFTNLTDENERNVLAMWNELVPTRN